MSPAVRPWLETAGVICLALFGVIAGRWCSKLRKPYWLAGYFVPLLLLAIIGTARRIPRLEFVPPFQWLMADRLEFALLAVICTMLLTTPLSRLPRRSEKAMVVAFMIFFTAYYSVLPFLLPALNYRYLAALETRLDRDGICLQSNRYNCGPAAAVTALRSLGIMAEEGELAILAHTTSVAGTPPDSLCSAIRRRHAVSCRHLYFKRIEDLRGKEPIIAIVKFAFFVDHYVTVLAVTDSKVIVGDPLTGKRELTHEEFSDRWRKCGIVIDQVRAPSGSD